MADRACVRHVAVAVLDINVARLVCMHVAICRVSILVIALVPTAWKCWLQAFAVRPC